MTLIFPLPFACENDELVKSKGRILHSNWPKLCNEHKVASSMSKRITLCLRWQSHIIDNSIEPFFFLLFFIQLNRIHFDLILLAIKRKWLSFLLVTENNGFMICIFFARALCLIWFGQPVCFPYYCSMCLLFRVPWIAFGTFGVAVTATRCRGAIWTASPPHTMVFIGLYRNVLQQQLNIHERVYSIWE